MKSFFNRVLGLHSNTQANDLDNLKDALKQLKKVNQNTFFARCKFALKEAELIPSIPIIAPV